jgi:four helix bundle protein
VRKSYQQLEVWRLAMELAVEAYAIARCLPAEERFGMAAQLRRAAVSVPSNIAEGHGRFSSADFARHLSIASGSVREVETVVLLAARVYGLKREMIDSVLRLADQVGRKISALIRAIHAQEGLKAATL